MAMKLTLNQRKRRAGKVGAKLRELFPAARISLNYSNEWERCVAVVLSAQCTDKKVNQVTDGLFKNYRQLEDYVEADLSEFEQDIKKPASSETKPGVFLPLR
jgi:endonuclease III